MLGLDLKKLSVLKNEQTCEEKQFLRDLFDIKKRLNQLVASSLLIRCIGHTFLCDLETNCVLVLMVFANQR